MSGKNNLKRLPGDDVIDEIERRIGSYDRTPFHGQLARALACGPSKTAWRKLAKADPAKWARALTDLGKISGFADLKQTDIHIKPEVDDVARELVAKYGYQKALQMWEPTGLPMEKIQAHAPIIEGETA
jgi:hypothetical protein